MTAVGSIKVGPFTAPIEPVEPVTPMLRDICEQVAGTHGVTVLDIKSESRCRNLVLARHEFFYRARTETQKSWKQIGRFCGDRDHTTVMHGSWMHAYRNNLSVVVGRYHQGRSAAPATLKE